MKYKWKVQSKPTGRYSSFEHRGFPEADYEDGRVAALMVCEDEYYPADVKIGKHKPITLKVADYSVTPWKWRKLVNKFKTVQDAKNTFERFLKQHPEFIPKSSGLPSNLGF